MFFICKLMFLNIYAAYKRSYCNCSAVDVGTACYGQWRRSTCILRGEIFSLTGRRGTKPEARKAESGDGVLGEGAASPLPTSWGVWKHCKLPQRDPGRNPRRI